MNKKQVVILIAAVVALAAIVALVKVLTSPGGPGGVPNHITIAQAMGGRSGQVVNVGGEVVPGSISWSNTSQSIGFILTGEGDRMQVIYQGKAPNDFRPGSKVVVEGTYDASGVFKATSLDTRRSPLCKACHGNG